MSMSMKALDEWVVDGKEPPKSAKLNMNEDAALVKDEYGNATGGIQLPATAVPRYTSRII